MNGTSNSSTLQLAIYSFPERLAAASMFSAILISGTIGNCMIIVAVALCKKLQTRTNVFVLSLSVADLLTCLSLFPTICALAGKEGWPLLGFEWLCTGGAFLLYICVGVSIYHLAAIAVNRMVVITYPTTLYRKMYSRYKLLVMISVLWVIPALVMIVPPILNIGGLGYDHEDTTCSDLDLHPNGNLFNFIQVLCLYPGPLLIMIICYSRTFWYIKKHFKKKHQTITRMSTFRGSDCTITVESSGDILDRDTLKRQKIQEIQITKNLFLVVLVFMLCFSPYALSLFIPSARRAVIFTGAFSVANSALNPVIYALKHPHFKNVLKLVVRCRFREIPEPSHTLSRLLSKI